VGTEQFRTREPSAALDGRHTTENRVQHGKAISCDSFASLISGLQRLLPDLGMVQLPY
jgi:hypothetical protein